MSNKEPVGPVPPPPGKSGWFAYAPNTGAIFVPKGGAPDFGPSTYVKLMPDYEAELPLWGCDEETLNLSPELLNDLRNWQTEFDDNFDPFESTNDRWVAIRDGWAEAGEALEARLRAEVPGDLDVVVDLWPLETEDE